MDFHSFDAFNAGVKAGGLRNRSEIRLLVCYLLSAVDAPVERDVLVNAVLIPQKAVLITQKGSFVMTLDKDNVVGTQKVEVSETIGDMYLVDSGLKGGERIICEGMVKARPGAKVSVMGDGQAQKGQAAQKTAQK